MWFMDSSPYWKEMQTKNFIPQNIEHRILWSKTWIVYNKMCSAAKTWKHSSVMSKVVCTSDCRLNMTWARLLAAVSKRCRAPRSWNRRDRTRESVGNRAHVTLPRNLIITWKIMGKIVFLIFPWGALVENDITIANYHYPLPKCSYFVVRTMLSDDYELLRLALAKVPQRYC